ncbi:hypothetical protein PLICRDRAFT_380933 [Plicaturopsis crispa FD-325 SS-3]|nr:hypothetical protein PLICRDRAFT_380933 [Plicaturopsis crispa FD-325 SS-3]
MPCLVGALSAMLALIDSIKRATQTSRIFLDGGPMPCLWGTLSTMIVLVDSIKRAIRTSKTLRTSRTSCRTHRPARASYAYARRHHRSHAAGACTNTTLGDRLPALTVVCAIAKPHPPLYI